MNNPALTPIFEAYETLVQQAESAFNAIKNQHPDCVKCRPGCANCCEAMFDLSLVEAMYLNEKFNTNFSYGQDRSTILENAAHVDRKSTRIKRDYFRQLRDAKGSPESLSTILDAAAKEKVRCPLLTAASDCALYTYRPITCRLYGVPTAIQGQGKVCSDSGFLAHQNYPTVFIAKIQNSLDGLSLQLQEILGSKFKELHKVYVPVSMALLTKYDDEYLGLKTSDKE